MAGERCEDCVLFSYNKKPDFSQRTVDLGVSVLAKDDPLTNRMGALLVGLGMSGSGGRRCSASGTAFGASKCVRPAEFSRRDLANKS